MMTRITGHWLDIQLIHELKLKLLARTDLDLMERSQRHITAAPSLDNRVSYTYEIEE
jgi:hypothetical protein